MQCNNPECTKDAKDKYCGSSCAAKISNKNRSKPRGNCNYCTKPLVGVATKFCDNRCQQNLRQVQAIELWLATGKAIVSSSPSHYIRTYIFEAQNKKCQICQMSPIWNSKEIRFILDHINGDPDNNNRENLRMICPNCDSQLDTYKAKNKGKGRHIRRTRYANGQSY